MTRVLYTDIDSFRCEWLERLVADGELPDGDVLCADIRDLGAAEVARYRQVHFFAGCGGWPLALALAGVPADAPVWTGSCPCQPFSVAGKRRGEDDPRHLWPEWRRLLRECAPPVVLGEQVARTDGRRWLDGVLSDLERLGFAVGAAGLPADASVGAPHARERLWFGALRVADAGRERREGIGVLWCGSGGGGEGTREAPRPGARAVADAERDGGAETDGGSGAQHATACARESGRPGDARDPWSDAVLVPCADGRARPVGAELRPLAHGLPRAVGSLEPGLRELAEVAGLDRESLRAAKRNWRGRVSAYGDAIVPPVAALFVRALALAIEETFR